MNATIPLSTLMQCAAALAAANRELQRSLDTPISVCIAVEDAERSLQSSITGTAVVAA